MFRRNCVEIRPGTFVACVVLGSFLLSPTPTIDHPAGRVVPQPWQSSDLPAEQTYLGTDQCITCHRKQASAWSSTKHANAYETLPSQYQNAVACLQCHLTGFGEPGGFSLNMKPDERQAFQSVGCEACHGPGAAHVEAVKRWTAAPLGEEDKLLNAIKKAIVKTPSDHLCATCHTTQAHQSHPYYLGQPVQVAVHPLEICPTTAATVTLPPTSHSYSVKTCASCHYTQYKHWQVETHSGIHTRLPEKYLDDEGCKQCHRLQQDNSEWHGADDASIEGSHQTGVGCESCHGPALEHVLFNKQQIGRTSARRDVEQIVRDLMRKNKPASACIQCHTRLGHHDHPAYDSPKTTENTQGSR